MPPVTRRVLILQEYIAVMSEFIPLWILATDRVRFPGTFPIIIIIAGPDSVYQSLPSSGLGFLLTRWLIGSRGEIRGRADRPVEVPGGSIIRYL